MSTISAIARADWHIIKDIIRQPDPANPFHYQVLLYVNGSQEWIDVTLDFKWGMASAEFSGDADPIFGKNALGVEV